MTLWHVIAYIKIIYGIIILTYFSYLDIKYREIPDKTVWAVVAGALILFLASIPTFLGNTIDIIYSLVSIIVGPLLLYLLYKMNLMGEADVYVVLAIAFLFPSTSIYSFIRPKY